MGGDAANDGGDHMKDAGIGLPATGAHVVTFPSFTLENGETLRDVRVAYSSYGRLAPSGNNGVVVGHSLTSNSVVHEWWGEMLGDGDQFAIQGLRRVRQLSRLALRHDVAGVQRSAEIERGMVRPGLPVAVHHPR